MRYPTTVLISILMTSISKNELTLPLLVIRVKELRVRRRAMLQDESLFYLLDIPWWAIVYYVKINFVILSIVSESTEYFSETSCTFTLIDVSHMFKLTASKVVRSSYIYQFFTDCYCVYHMERLRPVVATVASLTSFHFYAGENIFYIIDFFFT